LSLNKIVNTGIRFALERCVPKLIANTDNLDNQTCREHALRSYATYCVGKDRAAFEHRML